MVESMLSVRSVVNALIRHSRRRRGMLSEGGLLGIGRTRKFYGHMSDLGLRYGEEFRPIRELSAGAGQSAGKVSLSERIAHRAGRVSIASRPFRRCIANLFRGSGDRRRSQDAAEVARALR